MANQNDIPLGNIFPSTPVGDVNVLQYVINQYISQIETASLVQVTQVNDSDSVTPVGTVSVKVLVNLIGGDDNAVPSVPINNVPYFRLQGGANAIIVKPNVGDIGVAIFSSRDISVVKATKTQGNPGSRRQYSLSDGMYFGGFLNGTPTQFLQFLMGGVLLNTPGIFTVQSQKTELNSSEQTDVNAPVVNVTAPTQMNVNTPIQNNSGVLQAESFQTGSDGSFAINAPTVNVTANNGPVELNSPNGATINGRQILTEGGGGGSGTVTSVGLKDGSTLPIYQISGSPVLTAGVLTFSLKTQSAGTFFAAPSGSDGQPVFRAIDPSDIPILNQNTTGNAATATFATSAGYVTNALSAGTGLSGTTYNGAAPETWTLANSGVTAASYTNANITVDVYGRITAASNGTAGTVTSVGASFTGGLISISGSPITTSGTLAFTIAGTSGGIPYFSSSAGWASSSQLALNAIMVGGGAGAPPATITTGSNVLTALGVNVGATGAFIVNGGVLGTPSSGTLTNCTGYNATNLVGFGSANGVATLDSSGKLTSSQIPSSLVGALVYQGTWNASTNTPAITSGVGTKGWYYKTSVAGTTTIDGINQWNIGDTIVFDGTTWDKIDGIANEVVSVFGQTGAVANLSGDVSTSGSSVTTLANTGVSAGTYTYATVTVNAKGLITNISANSVTSGTVTSVALSLPGIFSISGSPITSSGTLTATFNTQNANVVFAGPSSGGAAIPTFRSLVVADLPTVDFSHGGTGQITQQAAMDALAGTQSSGKYLRSDGTHTTLSSISAGDVPTLNQNTTGTAASLAGGTANQIPYQTGSGATSFITAPTTNTILKWNGTSFVWVAAGSGTVTSVDLSMPAGFAVSNNPVTSSGTLTVTYDSGHAAKLFLATPNGSTGALGLRAIVASDIPTLNQNTTGSANAATNILGGALGSIPYQSALDTTALLAGNTQGTDQVLVSHGTGSIAQAPTLKRNPALDATNMINLPMAQATGILATTNGGTSLSTTPSDGQLLIGNGSAYTLATLTGVGATTVTNGSGSIKITSVDYYAATYAGGI